MSLHLSLLSHYIFSKYLLVANSIEYNHILFIFTRNFSWWNNVLHTFPLTNQIVFSISQKQMAALYEANFSLVK